MQRETRVVISVLVTVVVTWLCAAAENKDRPSVQVPTAYKELGSWKPSEPGDQLSKGKWWERFNDPELNRLEESLNISNQNIAAAIANVEAARAIVRRVALAILSSRDGRSFFREVTRPG